MAAHSQGAAVRTETQATSGDAVRSCHEFFGGCHIPDMEAPCLILHRKQLVVVTKPQDPEWVALAGQKSNFRIIAHSANADISVLIAASIPFDFVTKGNSRSAGRKTIPRLLQ